jgi:outer membrane receptor for ferrienterochelin and colicin
MNPFKKLIDATTYAEGNPFLKPEISYNFELSHSFKNSLFTTAGYSVTTDNITEVLIQDAVRKQTVQTTVNLNTVHFYSLGVTYSKRILPWWNTSTSFNGYYGYYSGVINSYPINQGRPTFGINSNNSISLPKDFSAEVSFRYDHKNLYGVTLMNEMHNLTIGVQKAFLNKRASVTVNFTDILYKAYPSGETNFGSVVEDWASKRDSRTVNVNFSYRFGKGPVTRMRRKTGADEEKQRAGNSPN